MTPRTQKIIAVLLALFVLERAGEVCYRLGWTSGWNDAVEAFQQMTARESRGTTL